MAPPAELARPAEFIKDCSRTSVAGPVFSISSRGPAGIGVAVYETSGAFFVVLAPFCFHRWNNRKMFKFILALSAHVASCVEAPARPTR
jgi:hypothetical protein